MNGVSKLPRLCHWTCLCSTHFLSKHPLKVTPPNTIILGVRVSACKCGRDAEHLLKGKAGELSLTPCPSRSESLLPVTPAGDPTWGDDIHRQVTVIELLADVE